MMQNIERKLLGAVVDFVVVTLPGNLGDCVVADLLRVLEWLRDVQVMQRSSGRAWSTVADS